MSSPSPAFYYGLLGFFTVVFTVFYAIAYSVLRGVVDNYRTYYQKADLQWTGPGAKLVRRVTGSLLVLLVAGSVLTSWLVVRFVIFHR